MNKTQQANFSFYSPMSLDKKIRVITYFVACGIGIGIPVFVGIINIWVYNNFLYMLFPIPFLGIVYLAWIYAPYAVGVRSDELHIMRRIGPIAIKLDDIAKVKSFDKLNEEAGWVLRTWGSGGAWGIYGHFWSKKWGHFKMHITNDSNYVLIELKTGKKIVVSPDQRTSFIQNLTKANKSITILK